MKRRKLRIGIVLARVPEYSETFFRNKIAMLHETDQSEVVLFADRYKANVEWTLCTVIYAVQLSGKRVSDAMLIGYYCAKALIFNPGKTLRLFWLNYRSGYSARKNVQSIVRSSHLFNRRIDWLHFGFGTMAINRETVAKVIGARLAVSFRGFDHYVFPLKNPGCYERLFKCADKIHVLSLGMKADLVNQGVPESAIDVITPAIKWADFAHPVPGQKAGGVTKIVTVSRLHWIKGLEYTLESLALLKEMGVTFHYTVAGEGLEYERLIFATHQLGLAHDVTFTGKLSHADVIEYLSEADLYLQYSIQEGFCNAVLEAQAMGLLCLVSDADGLRENVVHGETGWIVPKRQPKILAKKIVEVLNMEEAGLTAIRSAAVARAREHFNLENQKSSFMRFYSIAQK